MACYQIGVSKVLCRTSQLWWDDDKKTSLQPRHQSALRSLVEQAASEGGLQSGNSYSIGGRENGFVGIVESHQKPSHLRPGGSQVGIMRCAQWMACEANYYAHRISKIMLICQEDCSTGHLLDIKYKHTDSSLATRELAHHGNFGL